jgi:hypothetical protein
MRLFSGELRNIRIGLPPRQLSRGAGFVFGEDAVVYLWHRVFANPIMLVHKGCTGERTSPA